MNIDFTSAAQRLENVVTHTPLQLNRNLSRKFGCNIFLKREDLQIVRSYKLRGAYNMISSLPKEQTKNGVTCASAGNHAQGFAFSCNKLDIRGEVFMPSITPKQKINQTKMFGGENIEIQLVGDTFDDCAAAAKEYTQNHNMTFIPPFDHEKIIEGQGTVAVEIFEDYAASFSEEKGKNIDYVFIPVGGGGLASGAGLFFKEHSPKTKIIGVEPLGAPSLTEAMKAGKPVTLGSINPFVDGAAVKRIGDLTYQICKDVLNNICTVAEGKVCSSILEMYNENAIVVEPAGALSIAVLDDFKNEIKGKNVVCIVSGGNNDIDRMPEIKELSLQYEGVKHYFIINFVQRPGALREYLNLVLGATDDISRFEYIHKTNKDHSPALVGIELASREDYIPLIGRMKKYGIDYTELNKDDILFSYMV